MGINDSNIFQYFCEMCRSVCRLSPIERQTKWVSVCRAIIVKRSFQLHHIFVHFQFEKSIENEFQQSKNQRWGQSFRSEPISSSENVLRMRVCLCILFQRTDKYENSREKWKWTTWILVLWCRFAFIALRRLLRRRRAIKMDEICGRINRIDCFDCYCYDFSRFHSWHFSPSRWLCSVCDSRRTLHFVCGF